MKTIKGPIVPLIANNTVYQITLSSGMVITNPAAFGPDVDMEVLSPAIVGENGQVLTRHEPHDASKRVTQPSPISV